MGLCARSLRTRLWVLLGLGAFSVLLVGTLADLPSSRAAMDPESDSKKRQMEQIETDLSREKAKFRQLGLREKDLLGQLAQIERLIAEKRRLLEEVKKALRASEKELREQQEKLRKLERHSEEVKGRLSQRLIAYYKYAKRGYIRLLGTSRDLVELRKRMKYLRVIMSADQALLGRLAEVERKVALQIRRIQEKADVIEGMRNVERARLAAIKEEQDKKVFLLMKVHREKEFYETLVKELQQAAQNLKDTLLDLDRRRREKALPGGFASAKGKLPLPIKGTILKDRTQWGVDLVNTYKGIFIQGALGTEVRAVFPGRVDFSGWLKGYGETVVINHGSRFFTVSAHLAERFKEEGEMVEEGTVIGLLGQTGPFGKPRLYFEIRRAGTPLNPLSWVKVH